MALYQRGRTASASSMPITTLLGPWCEAPFSFFLANQWGLHMLTESIDRLELCIGPEIALGGGRSGHHIPTGTDHSLSRK